MRNINPWPDDVIFDPLDDIADFQNENNHSNSIETDFEYIETPNGHPDDTATSVTDVNKEEYEVTTPQKYILGMIPHKKSQITIFWSQA